jgi:hypothetical protein
MIVEGIVFVILAGLFFYLIRKIERRLTTIEKSVRYLSSMGKRFPELIRESEKITRNITEELTLKQKILEKLIAEAGKASEKLADAEEKIKDNKLDKGTIDKILILVNQGFTPAEIAPQLNIPLGEIELVIKLKKYLHAPVKEKL